MPNAKPRAWYQFTLRGALMLVLVCALLLGAIRYQIVRVRRQWRQEQEAIAALRSCYGPTSFDVLQERVESSLPQWLLPADNAEVLQRVVEVQCLLCVFTEDACRHLSSFRRLRKAALLGCEGTDQALQHLARSPQLRHFDLVTSDLTDAGMQSIRNLKALEFLDISGTQVTEAGLSELRHLTRLQTLYINGLDVSDNSVALLRPLPTLTGLVALDTRMTDAAFKQFPTLSSLKSLDAGSPQFENVHVSQMLHLEYLTLEGANIKTAVLSDLPRLKHFDFDKCTSLETLVIDGLPSLKRFGSFCPATLRKVRLSDLPKLEVIDFGGAHIRLRDNELRGLDDVKAVLLAFTPTSNSDLLQLEGLSKLSQLVLRGTCITDEGVSYLSRFRSLHFLDLAETQITDDAIAPLAALPSLLEVDLMGTQVTPKGVLKLRKSNANLRVLTNDSRPNVVPNPSGLGGRARQVWRKSKLRATWTRKRDEKTGQVRYRQDRKTCIGHHGSGT